MGELFFQELKNLVVCARVSSTGGNAQMEPASTTSHCNRLRKCVFVFWYSENGQSTNWHSWKSWFSRFGRAVFSCQWLSCTPFTQEHFWCHHYIPCPWKCGFWFTICHTFDILDQVIRVIVLMAAILDAILNLTHSARDPDWSPKFLLTWVHYQDQESKWGDIWLHTGPSQPRTCRLRDA